MKCSRCHALCPDHLPACQVCRLPFGVDDEPPPRLPRRAATLFAAFGLAISVSFLPPILPKHFPGPINMQRTMCDLGVSMACGLIGYWLGAVISKSRRAQWRVQAQRRMAAQAK